MIKTTVYLPDELDVRLQSESTATGVTKAELIRRGVEMVLESSRRPRKARPLPVFNSGRSHSAEEMDEAIAEQIADRAARR